MRLLYSLLFYLAVPGVLLRLWWRGRRAPAYRRRIAERFGFVPEITSQNIWVHAVSVGEVLAAIPVIKILKHARPAWHFIITTATPTGAERVKAAFKDEVQHLYMPYDLPCVSKRFLKRVRPKLLLIMETELWPNWFHYCAAQQIPIFIANARLSAKSAKGYQRLGKITPNMLKHITQLAAQTDADAERFVALGLDRKKIRVTGSVKFDLELPADLAERATQLRQSWGSQRPVWIAASTHEGEEATVLAAQQIVQQVIPEALFIWVPRHPERFAAVAHACAQHFQVTKRSEQAACTTDTQIYIGDTMGEMLLFYAAADVAFVGGSLVERGGQNPIEPGALGLPILSGPHFYNFAAISAQLQAAGAERIVTTAEELAQQVITLLQDPSLRTTLGAQARHIVEQNRGAVTRQVAMITELLHSSQ